MIARPPRAHPSSDGTGGAPARHPARAPRLRQPQPAPRQDRDGRLRHGLHAGALQPGAHRGAVDPGDARQARDGQGATRRRSAPSPTIRSSRCAGSSSTATTATSSSPTATATRGARATASRRSSATRSRSSTSASAPACRRGATPGSTRCSRCPRRCCTRGSSTTSIATTPSGKPDYTTLWEHIRECIDLAHRDGSIKTIVSAPTSPSYIERDEALAETLHKFRSSGKRLFLLTNSAWDYTSTVMSYLLDGALARLPQLAQLLRRRRRQRRQAGVLHRRAPVPRARRAGEPAREEPPGARSSAAASTQGGNLKEFEERARASGDRVLFVGDHIYGDMLRSRKSSNWRTAMVLQEMEHEVATYDRLRAELARARPARRRAHPPRRRAQRAAVGAARAAEARRAETPRSTRSATRAAVKDDDRAGCARRCARPPPQHRTLEDEIDHGVQPVLGPALPRGLRDQQVRRAGRGLRLRLHEPRLELPLLLADAVLPRPARPHAARALRAGGA